MPIKRFLIFAALIIGFAGCQCADPPPVPPVEDEGQAAHLVVPSAELTPSAAALHEHA